MPYAKRPWHKDDGIGTLMLAMLIFFLFVMALSVMCIRPADAEDGKVVVTVRDFGRGMTPVMPPYVNDPEAIVLSQNMYSTQPGSRQLRFGTTRLVPSKDTNAVDSDHGISALSYFTPAQDSGYLVYASGGKYYYNTVGVVSWKYFFPPGPFLPPNSPKFVWVHETLQVSREIAPPSYGTSVRIAADSDFVFGTGTRFIRDAAVGDTITIDTASRRVAHVLSDEVLLTTANWAAGATKTSWDLTRGYDSATTPFLIQSGDYMFSGSVATPTQFMYADKDSSVVSMRELGIVDSFYVDDIINIFSDTLRGSYDTLANGKKMLREIQVVSRRKGWAAGQWGSDVSGNPVTYYVRLGFGGHGELLGTSDWRTRYFAINGNTDTSIILRAWYVDSLINGTTTWADSIFAGKAAALPFVKDTIHDTSIVGTWGYIYNSAGNLHTVIPDDSSPTATLYGRGAMWMITGANASIVSDELFYDGMYWIQLTGGDVAFPSFRDTSNAHTYTYTCTYPLGGERCKPPDVPDSLILGWTSKRVNGGRSIEITYTIYTNLPITTGSEYLSVTDGKFPIRYAYLVDSSGTANDTLVLVTGQAVAGLNDRTTQTTNRWELVRSGMPRFSGVAEWNSPAQLVGWGDSAGASVMSFSDIGNPFDWPVINDVAVGDNPSDPIIGVVGYDDQLVIFKRSSMLAYPGFKELSITDGLVGPRAVVGLNKYLYWLDVDGLKRIARRDFSGYTVENVSGAMAPVFNSWNPTTFGASVVPFRINPRFRESSILTYNQRDQHLYLFFPQGTDTTNSKCLTYDIQNNKWDGYFTLEANDAAWLTIRDTSRIVIGNPDSAMILGLDYSFNDVGNVGIDGDLKSAKFWVRDEQGWPMESVLNRVRFKSRSLSAAFDSAYILIVGDTKTDTLDLTYSGAWNDIEQLWRPSGNNLSEYWNWEIKTYGDSLAGLFIPYELQMEFAPVKRDD